MKSVSIATACAALLLIPVSALAAKPNAASRAKPESVSMNAADLKWGAAPPSVPRGAQMVVLHGDPTRKGPFALRLKLPDGYKISPHWHSMDEELTILSGTFVLHMGDSMDAPAHSLEAGGFHFLPGKMHHAAEARGEVVLEMHGMGPFDIHYLNPKDDPTKTNAQR